jgi:hypothetical protein
MSPNISQTPLFGNGAWNSWQIRERPATAMTWQIAHIDEWGIPHRTERCVTGEINVAPTVKVDE